MWPGGVMNGMVYPEQRYINALPVKPPFPPAGSQCRGYELCSVLYWDGPMQGRRFQGLYAEIRDVAGTVAELAVWQPGTSLVPGMNPIGLFWAELDTVAHPIEPGFTQIGIGPTDPKSGALFVDVAARKVIPFDPPKNPRPLGGASVPRRRVVR
jgi:hypothetical protein